MAKYCTLSDGINKLGNWAYSFSDEDLSTLKFYDESGNEVSRPVDFPTDEQIRTAKADAQTETAAKDAQRDADKASAKAKLIAGEALTEAEADTIVL